MFFFAFYFTNQYKNQANMQYIPETNKKIINKILFLHNDVIKELNIER